jgi:aprataxin
VVRYLEVFLVIKKGFPLCSLEHVERAFCHRHDLSRVRSRSFIVLSRFNMSSLTILRAYAQKNPAELPSSILFSHTSTSLTIYDAFPKSIFHFLVLPRIIEPHNSTADLSSLRSCLRSDKARARGLISALRDDAKMVAKEIEAEMMKRYGFTWEIWTGFHGAPSME